MCFRAPSHRRSALTILKYHSIKRSPAFASGIADDLTETDPHHRTATSHRRAAVIAPPIPYTRTSSADVRPSPASIRQTFEHKGEHCMKTALRRILSESARLDVPLDNLADDADLYAAGLSSLATVHLMLAMEDEFDVEIPDRMLTRRLFSSIDSMAAAITELLQAKAAA
jgi:acyl carrier protein